MHKYDFSFKAHNDDPDKAVTFHFTVETHQPITPGVIVKPVMVSSSDPEAAFWLIDDVCLTEAFKGERETDG